MLDPKTEAFYRDALRRLNEAGMRYLVGGAYAFAAYTGIVRHTKDLDLFLTPADSEAALDLLAEAGYRIERTDPIWLGKIFSEDAFVDLIFRSGNGISEVDRTWFERAPEGRILGIPVRLCRPEDTIWSKAFIMERERYDGADVAHYILVWGKRMDWDLLIERFAEHWRVLLSHLILFGFIYPESRGLIPRAVMKRLIGRLRAEPADDEKARTCQGTLLSRVHFLVDTGPWGMRDARFQPRGSITVEQIEAWRERADEEKAELLRRAGIFLEGLGAEATTPA